MDTPNEASVMMVLLRLADLHPASIIPFLSFPPLGLIGMLCVGVLCMLCGQCVFSIKCPMFSPRQVCHPKVKERIFMDFIIMKKIAAFADRTPSLKWMNLGPSMEQFSHTMAAQVRLMFHCM